MSRYSARYTSRYMQQSIHNILEYLKQLYIKLCSIGIAAQAQQQNPHGD